MNKSENQWHETRIWCVKNPAKIAAIVTPKGAFTIRFEEHKDMKLSDNSLERIRWVKGLFLND